MFALHFISVTMSSTFIWSQLKAIHLTSNKYNYSNFDKIFELALSFIFNHKVLNTSNKQKKSNLTIKCKNNINLTYLIKIFKQNVTRND